MSKKQFVEKITSMEDDFAQWYTDVVTKARLVDYSSVRGSMIIQPYGFKIWENIRDELDRQIKETGHENVYMPLFIPESLLQQEKDHIEGFAPEVAWVTHGGESELQERLCVRPTSEVLFAEHYKNIIHSYRDLPKLYNQWANVVRWEKTTRPFLRTLEFLWQEGHTCHETEQEAIEETERMLHTYASLCEDLLAIPVIKGRKTEKEKFAGARFTYTVESLMHDGKALQTATSHFFGNGFAKAFGIEFLNREGKLEHVQQTSWGFTTR
ncbi:MAG: proline--tRNA ligase, partial [Bacillus sp. (in: Bacteria)]|nr:proline--tRNA ligase [Bacillus sp. (in: firmicutes)]